MVHCNKLKRGYGPLNEELEDFSRSEYTAVISDLHLCEEEPLHPRYPLWKKYKTKQFFFDREFKAFLDHLETQSGGCPVELVLNGDIFDFDSVTSLPASPPYRVSWLEKKRGLHPEEEKSCFKLQKILADHPLWVESLRQFIKKGHRVVFVIGNHDLELHFLQVQQVLLGALNLDPDSVGRVRFNEWFYISNGDSFIEHGNQYDPYCMAQDPVNPFIRKYNRLEVRVPFGNLATRYMINGMGFFNPHLDSNYIMSAPEYVRFFVKYMLRAQPLIILTWIWGASLTVMQSFVDRLKPALRDPLTAEDRIEVIARKSNASPRMVRELQELFVTPASSYPLIILRELWLDRALLVFFAFALIFQVFLVVKTTFEVSFFWMFIPLFLFLPFFIFYSRSVSSNVMESKEPREKILHLISLITKVNRVIFGHTHHARHEVIGAVEHLNSGTWSPAFADVECEKPVGEKSYVWIYPNSQGLRESQLLNFSLQNHDKESLRAA